MATQSLWAGPMRMAQYAGMPGVNLLCGIPNTPLSKEVLAALKDIADIIGEDIPTPPDAPVNHCADCIMSAYYMVVPSAAPHIIRKNIAYNYGHSLRAAHFIHSADGPPLGSRAPPVLA